GKALVSSGSGAPMRFWDPTTGARLREAPAKGAPRELTYLRGGKVLAGIDDQRVCLYDAATGKRLRRLDDGPGAMANLRISPDGKRIAATWSVAHTVYLWDVASGKLRHRPAGLTGAVRTLAVSPDGRTLLSANEG